jgi:hypothetical protein
MGKDFIPGKDADLDGFAVVIKTTVEYNTTGTHPNWENIPAETVTALSDAVMAYHSAFAKMAGDHTKADTEWKNKKRKEAVTVIRSMVKQYLRFPPVTDENRIAMNIPNRDTTPTNRPVPTSQPDAEVLPTPNRYQHMIRALNHATSKAKKPDDAYGVRFAWQLGGERPATGADLPRTKFTRKTTHVVTYTEADKKKTAYYAVCYENGRGDAGPWSPLVEMDIA